MLPGFPSYLPNLIQSLVQETGSSFPAALFTSLLLCMVAGDGKHVILRTREEDVEELKALVVRVLVTIFGLPTQRLALKPEDTVVDFLTDCFLIPPPPSSYMSQSQIEPSPTSPSSKKPRSSRGNPTVGRRTRKGSNLLNRSESEASMGFPRPEQPIFMNKRPSVSGRRHERSESSVSHGTNASLGTATGSLSTVRALRTQSNASQVGPAQKSAQTLGESVKNFSLKPNERSGLFPPADDAASVTAIRPDSTHGLHIETDPPTPTLSPGSLPAVQSPGEYPPHSHHHHLHQAHRNHSSDYGTPSAGLTSAPRLPHALVLSKLEKSSPEVQIALADVMRAGSITFDDYLDDSWDLDFGDEPRNRVHDGRRPSMVSWNLPRGFVVVYVCPLGDERERVAVERCLLDRFVFNGRIRLEPGLYNASPGPFRRTALISREEIEKLRELSSSVYIAPELQTYISSLLTAVRCQPQLDGTLLSARCVTNYSELVRASRVVLGRYERSSDHPTTQDGIPAMSATDSDARRMLVNALEHRLSVRKGPWDEVMGSMYGPYPLPGRRVTDDDVEGDDYAADDEGARGAGRHGSLDDYPRETIQAILLSILEDV